MARWKTKTPVINSLLRKVHYRLIRNLAAQGLTISEVAEVLEIDKETLAKRLRSDDKLEAAFFEGSRTPVKLVEQSLFQRAIGYNYEEYEEKIIYKDGVPIHLPTKKAVRHLPPDTKAAELYLTNRAPDRWKRVNQLNIQGSLTLRDRAGLVRDRL